MCNTRHELIIFRRVFTAPVQPLIKIRLCDRARFLFLNFAIHVTILRYTWNVEKRSEPDPRENRVPPPAACVLWETKSRTAVRRRTRKIRYTYTYKMYMHTDIARISLRFARSSRSSVFPWDDFRLYTLSLSTENARAKSRSVANVKYAFAVIVLRVQLTLCCLISTPRSSDRVNINIRF